MSWPSEGRDRRDSGTYSKLPTSDSGDAHDPFSTSQLAQLREQRREQDANLNILGKSVSRLGQLSLSISKEIDSQNEMLDELDEEVNAAQETADVLTRRRQSSLSCQAVPSSFAPFLFLALSSLS